MNLDCLLMIPHLSKELNLIGFSELPYTLEKAHSTKSKKSKNKNFDETYKIKFNSKIMIQALTSVCFELVKQIKTFGVNDCNFLDKLHFESIKLEKQLKASNFEILKKTNELTAAKKVIEQQQEKLQLLEQKIKDHDIVLKNLVRKNQNKENILKHSLRKKELDLFELHKAIWKQFNMADQNYLPETFKIVQLNQPNFNQLWSEVKYSDANTRTDLLKKAVCIFQANNIALVEENFLLKTFLLTILQEIHELLKLMVDKMYLPNSVLVSYEKSEIIIDVEKFDASVYKKILHNYFSVIKQMCELFDEVCFTVSDEIFVCWSSIIKSF